VDHVKYDSDEWTIISTLSSPHPESFNIPVRIQEESLPLSAFIDSGAMGNFIHPRVVSAHKLPTTKRAKPLLLQTVTGKTFHKVTQQVQTLMTTKHGHEETITLDVAPIGKHQLLLGLPWCKLHQIQFDWNNEDILSWGPKCEQHFPRQVSEVTLGHSAHTHLTPQSERYQELKLTVPQDYHDFLDVFDAEYAMSKCPEPRPGYDFEIHLKDNAKLPPPAKPYHLSQGENRILKEWLQGMRETGMITRCSDRCPTAAPVFFVRKKDGTKRPVIDYWKLNDITIRNAYPLPRIDQIMDRVKGSRIFSKFDMKSGYNQIRIKKGQEWLTAFNTPDGPHQSNVLTFGLMNAPPHFQKFVNDHLYNKPEMVENILGYLDDANVHTPSLETHVPAVRRFLQLCREAKVFLNPKKCEFHQDQIDFLGVELSGDGFRMDEDKCNAIREWKPPSKVRGVREFIGFCNFYRRFIRNFAEIARPLHDLTKNTQTWQWNRAEENAFQTLKKAVASSPVLAHPNLDLGFRVETDASNYAYGAVLSQRNSDDHKYHPVAFYSKSMNPAERNYGISDKETLAIVKALQHWRHWLEGTVVPVEIITDHKNLEYFTRPRVLNRRQLRWQDLLTHYNYTITYRPGHKNGAADALSRREELAPEDAPEDQPTTLFSKTEVAPITGQNNPDDTENPSALFRQVAELTDTVYPSDEHIRELIRVEGNQRIPEDVVIVDGIPYHDDRVYVPDVPSIKLHILRLYHDSPIAGHLGQSGTYELIKRGYWWPRMAAYVKAYVKGCYTCAQNKHTTQKTPGTMQPLPAPLGPWEWTQSDHITGLPRSQGHDAIYVVMDRLTKMTHFIPTNTRATAEDLVQLHLKHVWKHHGIPKIHNTDRGSTFTADYTRRFFKALNIDQRFSTAYHPQTQGQVENNNKWVETYIRMFCNRQQNDWADLLHLAEFVYNNHHHPSINMSPFKANFGYDMTLTPDNETRGRDTPLRLALLKKLHQRCSMWIAQSQDRQKKSYDKRRSEQPPLEEGSKVWISSRDLATDQPSPKLEALRFGPYRVEKVMGPLTYQIRLPSHWRVNNVFHRSKLTAVAPAIDGQHNHVTNPTNVTQAPHIGEETANENTQTPSTTTNSTTRPRRHARPTN